VTTSRQRRGTGYLLIGAMAAIAAAGACGRMGSDGQPAPTVSIGTSSVGSEFYSLAVAMAEVLTRQAGLSVTAEPVGGSDANLRALRDGKIDLALVNADSADAAYAATRQFAGEPPVRAGLVAQGQPSLRQIVVRADSGIQSPADLAGKRFIARRRALADIERFARLLLDAYGIPEDGVTIIETAETNEATEALKLGTADAAIIPGGLGSSFLLDLSQTADVRFLSIPDDKLRLILNGLGPAFRKGVIPEGTYEGQPADVAVPALPALLIARATLPEDVVYRVTATLMDQWEAFNQLHSAASYWTVENSVASPAIPFHPGAARYYRERGHWSDDLSELP
jgi:TRAP transporter TAXI family solute receptor